MRFVFRFDNAAHLGGLLSGALLALVVGADDRPSGRAADRLWEAAAWGAGLAVVGCFVMVALRYQDTLQGLVQGTWLGFR